MFEMALLQLSVIAGFLAALALGSGLEKRETDRMVFCHFILGIVGNRTSSADYDADMILARDSGIDAFALNIGIDLHTDEQLDFAYESAARNDMKVFLSFDFSSYSRGDAATVGKMVAAYADKAAQLVVDEGVFVSSFVGDGLDTGLMKKAADMDVFWVPNWSPDWEEAKNVDGAFNWQAWPSDGKNKAPTGGKEVSVEDGDEMYEDWLGKKPYMAPISPWFSTHFGPESSHPKNFVFPSGALLFNRWQALLASSPAFIEMISWNDYGESHYVGPLSSPHTDDGASKWVNDMPHTGWLELSRPFIAAYKAGEDKVDKFVEEDRIVYWYRRTLKGLDCEDTDTTADRTASNDSGNYFMGRPNGFDTMEDVVYVATLLTQGGKLTVESGDGKETHDVPKGATLIEVPARVGSQSFKLELDDGETLEATSLMEIEDVCPCGIYNFNAYVGTVPHGEADRLQKGGLEAMMEGLKVTTCEPTPTLALATEETGESGGTGHGGEDGEDSAAGRLVPGVLVGLGFVGLLM